MDAHIDDSPHIPKARGVGGGGVKLKAGPTGSGVGPEYFSWQAMLSHSTNLRKQQSLLQAS